MGAPILRLDGVAAPTYGKDSPFFTVELIHGGFFHGSGDNRSYLSGAKACYDFCDNTSVCIRMFDDLIEDIGYETAGRIRLYWLLPGCQLNEDGARLLSNDEETESIVRVVRNGHKFLMFYVDHQDSYNGGGGKEWDDVIANPIAHLPPIFSPKKENIHTVVIEHQSPKRKEGKAWLKEKEMQKYQDKRKSRRKKRLADEKRMIAHTSFQQEEAEFLMHQADEEERRMGWQEFKEAGEVARQQAWDMQNNHEDTTRNEEWEQRKRKAEERNNIGANEAKKQAMDSQMKEKTAAGSSKAEEERLHPSQFQRNKPKKVMIIVLIMRLLNL